MALDRSALDAARKLNNLPPLTDAEFASLSGNGSSDAEKEKQLQLEKETADKAKLEKEKNDNSGTPTPEVKTRELSEEEILKIVAEKTGKSVSSWDDLKPKEELDAVKIAEEREADKLSWALKNKKFKQKEYESFISDSKDPKGLVQRLRYQQALKENPELKQEDFEEEFNEEFGLNEKPESRRYKNGMDTLNRIADSVLKGTYGSIYGLENEYSQYESSVKAHKERETKFKTELPAYKKSLDKVFVNLKKIKAQLGENEEYEVEALDESLNTIKEMMSEPKWVEQQIQQGYNEDELKEIAYTKLLRDNFPYFANKIAEQRLYKHAKGTKGIPQVGLTVREEDYQLTEEQKTLKSLIEQNKKPAEVAAN